MTTTADNLARALRALIDACEDSGDFARNAFSTEAGALSRANDALEAYDSVAPVVSVADVAREMRQRAAEHRIRKRHGRAAELDQFAARLES